MIIMELKGKVVIKRFAKGSKSEHDAVYLETDQGNYVLRQAGANPFADPKLKKLVGKRISAEGTLKDYLFLAKVVKVIDEKNEEEQS
jgi:hypothetical protein